MKPWVYLNQAYLSARMSKLIEPLTLSCCRNFSRGSMKRRMLLSCKVLPPTSWRHHLRKEEDLSGIVLRVEARLCLAARRLNPYLRPTPRSNTNDELRLWLTYSKTSLTLHLPLLSMSSSISFTLSTACFLQSEKPTYCFHGDVECSLYVFITSIHMHLHAGIIWLIASDESCSIQETV